MFKPIRFILKRSCTSFKFLAATRTNCHKKSPTHWLWCWNLYLCGMTRETLLHEEIFALVGRPWFPIKSWNARTKHNLNVCVEVQPVFNVAHHSALFPRQRTNFVSKSVCCFGPFFECEQQTVKPSWVQTLQTGGVNKLEVWCVNGKWLVASDSWDLQNSRAAHSWDFFRTFSLGHLSWAQARSWSCMTRRTLNPPTLGTIYTLLVVQLSLHGTQRVFPEAVCY